MIRGLRKKNFLIAIAVHVTALLTVTSAFSAAAPQSEWEKTIATAEQEGQVTVYGAPGITYQNAMGAFQERFPKIRLLYVPGSGSNNAQRLMAERRSEKYLADVFVGGSGTLIEVLFDGGVLDPLPPALILPEVKDQSLWFNEKHILPTPKASTFS